MTEPTDADLLARFRAGEDAALGALFDRYGGPVYRFLVGMLRDRHKAEDVLQETFVRVLRHADGVTPETFRGWLYSVAHQQAVLLKRRERRVPAGAADAVLLGLVDGADAPPAAADRADAARRLQHLIGRLPPAQREVVRLRVFEGLKFREVAERVGCPLNTALARMHDGLQTLRTLWGDGA